MTDKNVIRRSTCVVEKLHLFPGYYRYSLHYLHIAYLARNPRLPAMCDKFESMLGQEGRSLCSGEDDMVRNCIAYLREHPLAARR